MATVPVTPVIPAKPAAAPVVPAQTWLQAHERLVIVFLVLLVGSWGITKFFDARAQAAENRATVAEQTLVSQKTQNTENIAVVTQLTQQYQQLVQSLAAQNAALASSVAARQTAQAVQVVTDTHLAPSELATRLGSLGNAPVDSVTVAGEQISLTQPAAIAVTQTLEALAPLRADLADTQNVLKSTQATEAQASAVVDSQKTEILGLNTTLTDQVKACKVQVAAVKAEGRKNSIKWFKRGFGLGFLTGLLGGHYGF